MKASLAWENLSSIPLALAPARPDLLCSDVLLTGVGLIGLRWGGARALPSISYWVVGSEASWRVREPSDQRFIRALDWSLEWSEGECRQRIVVIAVLYAEKVVDGAFVLWWSVVGGWKAVTSQDLGLMATKEGIFRRYIWSSNVSEQF